MPITIDEYRSSGTQTASYEAEGEEAPYQRQAE